MSASRHALLLAAFVWTSAQAASFADTVADQLRQRIELSQTRVGPTLFAVKQATLLEFYRDRDFRPVWIERRGPTSAARVLRGALASAAREGLEPTDYPVSVIDKLMQSASPSALTDLELLLTQEFVHYVSDAATGRLSPSVVDPERGTAPVPVTQSPMHITEHRYTR